MHLGQLSIALALADDWVYLGEGAQKIVTGFAQISRGVAWRQVQEFFGLESSQLSTP